MIYFRVFRGNPISSTFGSSHEYSDMPVNKKGKKFQSNKVCLTTVLFTVDIVYISDQTSHISLAVQMSHVFPEV